MANAMVAMEFEARFSKLEGQMSQVSSIVKAGTQQIRQSMVAVGEGANGAGGAIGKLQSHLLDWRKEATQEGRAATFFAAQIEKIGVVSKETGGALSELASGFAFGGAMGVATELVKLAVGAYFSLGKEAKAAGEALKKAGEEATKAWTDYAQSLNDASEARRIFQKVAGKQESERDAAAFRAQKLREEIASLKEAADRQHQITQELEAQVKATGSAVAAQKAAASERAEGKLRNRLGRASTELSGINEKFPGLDNYVEQQKAMLSEAERAASGSKVTEIVKKDQQRREQLEAEHEASMLQISAQGMEGKAKIEAEGLAKIAEIRKRYMGAPGDTLAMMEEEIAAQKAKTARRVFDFEDDYRIKQLERDLGNGGLEGDAPGLDKLKEQNREDDRKKAERRAEPWVSAANSISATWSRAWASMLKGETSVAEGLKETFTAILDAFVDMVTQMIAKWLAFEAIQGIAGLFGIPIPAGLLAGARADGGPVSYGLPYFVGERGPEVFVPSQSGSIVPNGALAMAGGGGMSVTIYALDSKSLEQALDRNDSVLVRKLKRLAGAGRL